MIETSSLYVPHSRVVWKAELVMIQTIWTSCLTQMKTLSLYVPLCAVVWNIKLVSGDLLPLCADIEENERSNELL